MTERYKSQYYSDLNYFLKVGWTENEIDTYFPIMESLSDSELLELHELCHISMFKEGESVDKEQAIHALVNPHDTPKDLLLSAVFIQQCEKYIKEKEQGEIRGEEAAAKIVQLWSSAPFLRGSIFEEIDGFALEVEIPREMSVGAGIAIGDTWTQEIADEYKEKQWKELKELIEKGRAALIH